MIHDHLNNSCRYEHLHPRFKVAFDFLKSVDLHAISQGHVNIDGENVFATVSVVQGITEEDSLLEAHVRYVDIQLPIDVAEMIGWASINNLSEIAKEYDADRDVLFYQEKATNFATLLPMEFAVFFPEDAHQPCIAKGQVKKVVVKILL